MKKSIVRYFSIIGYVFLLLFNCFMFYFLGNYFNLIFLAALLIIPFVAYVAGKILLSCITAEISGASLVENRKDEFIFQVSVKNSSILFTNNGILSVTVANPLFQESVTHTLNLPVIPLGKSSVSYPVTSRHCGIVTIKLEEIYLYDFLNLFTFHKTLDIVREIPVFPDLDVINDDFSMDFSEGYNNLEESQTKGNDSTEVSDIREYIPGDKLQNIHWKLSAKKDILMVKEHVSLTSSQLLFYIELANPAEGILDKILDTAYGIGNFLCIHGIPFSFFWYSTRQRTCRFSTILNSASLRDTLLEVLYEVPLLDYKSMENQIKQLSGHENFITIGVDYVMEKDASEKK